MTWGVSTATLPVATHMERLYPAIIQSDRQTMAFAIQSEFPFTIASTTQVVVTSGLTQLT